MSDHIEHACAYCGSLLHPHTDDRPCPEYLKDVDDNGGEAVKGTAMHPSPAVTITKDEAAMHRMSSAEAQARVDAAIAEAETYPPMFKTGVTLKPAGEVGKKRDQGKLRWGLLPLGPVREIIGALMYGAEKYGAWNWQVLMKQDEAARERYYSAMQRHVTDWWDGAENDEESGLHHLAHAGACLLFLLWWERNKPEAVSELDPESR